MPDSDDNLIASFSSPAHILSPHPAQTMSSREIAELCDKRHDHVMRDIRDMLAQIHVGADAPKFGGVYKAGNGEDRPCFNLPKRETLILVSGYNLIMRAKIIDRWQELEAAPLPTIDVRSLPQLQTIALQLIEVNRGQSEQIAFMAPKVAAFDRIASAEGSLCLTDAAKVLQMRRIDLERELHAREWIYRRPGSGKWRGHAPKERQGLLTHKWSSGRKPDGTEWSDEQVRITPKGLVKISLLLGIELQEAA
jgi:phage regulator Rha-like protein